MRDGFSFFLLSKTNMDVDLFVLRDKTVTTAALLLASVLIFSDSQRRGCSVRHVCDVVCDILDKKQEDRQGECGHLPTVNGLSIVISIVSIVNKTHVNTLMLVLSQ